MPSERGYQRAYAERHADRWFIISAKYGLIHPDGVIDPYEQTLAGARVAVRREWARRVFQEMESAGLTAGCKTFLWLAGQAYQKELSKLLHAHEHIDPLAGMGIGHRLGWLKAQAGGGFAVAQRPNAPTQIPRSPAKQRPAHLERESGAPVIELTFAEVAELVGGLPASAYKDAAWWSDRVGHPQSQDGWLAAGYRVGSANRALQTVTIRRA